jgi:uncharacterized membrane protein
VARAIGEHVEADEPIGWVAADEGHAVSAGQAADLAATLVVTAARELDHDPALGIRILVDVANRAASSNVDDPYTACQALWQLRSVLHYQGQLPAGDLNVVDPDGSLRVSVMAVKLRELLSIAVDGPLRRSNDPDVVEAMLEIGVEVAMVATDEEDRAAVRLFLDRMLSAAARHADLPRPCFERLRAQASQMRQTLRNGYPGPGPAPEPGHDAPGIPG